MELCPVCRHRDTTCKIRLLRGQTFFSCKSCFEAEERKAPPRPAAPRGPWADRGPALSPLIEEALSEKSPR